MSWVKGMRWGGQELDDGWELEVMPEVMRCVLSLLEVLLLCISRYLIFVPQGFCVTCFEFVLTLLIGCRTWHCHERKHYSTTRTKVSGHLWGLFLTREVSGEFCPLFVSSAYPAEILPFSFASQLHLLC
jgi:hypothetical protein